MDRTSVLGLLIGLLAIVGGQILEGGILDRYRNRQPC
jgi:flagellar motor component MotA